MTICIASIGRKSLLATLDSLSKCKLQAEVTLNVVIADDSSTGVVQPLIDGHTAEWFFNVQVVRSASANIAIARNACLENAKGDYLAFIDDDETVDQYWIYSYVNLALALDADAFFGSVDAIYPEGAARWICDAKPFVKKVGVSGASVKEGSTCNAFVKKSKIDELKLRFRVELGRSGGEDTAFFSELRNGGGILVACDKAKVYEEVPIGRLNIAHLSRRYIRGGQTYANLYISNGNVIARALAYVISFFKVIFLSILVPLLYLVRKDVSLKYAFKFWLNLGKLRNLLNMSTLKLY